MIPDAKYHTVALQVVVGGNHHIYRKLVSMPILPIGSLIRFDRCADSSGLVSQLYIQGYWWEDGLTIVWLSTWRHLQDDRSERGNRYSMLSAYLFDRFSIEYKKVFLSLGFEKTNTRIETV